MLIITNAEGQVVAAVPEGRKGKSELNVALSPMSGQTLHSVDVPAEIMKITMGSKFHSAISNLIVLGESNK